MWIDKAKNKFFFNDYLFIDIKKTMLDFHDHTPEKVWPSLVEQIMDIQSGLIKTISDYKQIVGPESINKAQHIFLTIWNSNKDSLEQWDINHQK